jgi:hypothetical protein
MNTADRSSPSGPAASRKGTMAIASTPVALTAAATQTGTFDGARVGDVIELSPKANLTASIAVAFKRVVTDDTIVVGFTNVGASTAQAAVTFDVVCQKR